MMPYMFDDVFKLVKQMMKRIIKPSVMAKVKTVSDLVKLDLTDDSNYVHPKDMELHYTAVGAMKKSQMKLSDKEKLTFRSEYLQFSKAALIKIMERCPLRFKILRGLSCISPSIMLQPVVGVHRIKCLIRELMDLDLLDGGGADTIKADYETIINDARIVKLLSEYEEKDDRLENLFNRIFNIQKDTSVQFKKVVKTILTMFHGNADVERGFSVNKHCISDNLQEDNLVSRRLVCEYVQKDCDGDATQMDTDKKMLLDCRNASHLRKDALEKKSKEKKTKDEVNRRKRKLMDDISEKEEKKKKTGEEADREIESIQAELRELKTQK